MQTKVTRIRRSSEASTVEGKHITGVKDAHFISLVGLPANQRSFSIVRDDQKANQAPGTPKRITRTKRNDQTNVAQVVFPAGYEHEAVVAKLTEFGMADYTVAVRDDKTITATRSDLQSIADEDVHDIKLTADGVVARTLRGDAPAAASGKTQLVMASIEFSSDSFSRQDAKAWLEENNVDFDEKALDNSTGNFVLQRADVAEGEEARPMELSPGVVAMIKRDDVINIPADFVLVVSEAAYGGWGWGQLDFAARLADIEVGEKLREGLDILDGILRNVLFYSDLPIDSRKELAHRSLNQFGAYAGTLLDQLPRQLLIQVGNAQRNDKAQEPTMLKDSTGNETKLNAEGGKAEDVLSVTRGDLQAMVAEAVKASKEENVQRDDANKPAGDPAKVEPAAAPAATQASAGLTRDDLAAVVREVVAPLTERLEKIETTAIVRSDNKDPKTPEPEGNLSPEQAKIKREDKFAGVDLFGRGGR